MIELSDVPRVLSIPKSCRSMIRPIRERRRLVDCEFKRHVLAKYRAVSGAVESHALSALGSAGGLSMVLPRGLGIIISEENAQAWTIRGSRYRPLLRVECAHSRFSQRSHLFKGVWS